MHIKTYSSELGALIVVQVRARFVGAGGHAAAAYRLGWGTVASSQALAHAWTFLPVFAASLSSLSVNTTLNLKLLALEGLDPPIL